MKKMMQGFGNVANAMSVSTPKKVAKKVKPSSKFTLFSQFR